MSACARHVAELAARLMEANRMEVACDHCGGANDPAFGDCQLCLKPLKNGYRPCLVASEIAQDVDKLLRLSASLRGMGFRGDGCDFRENHVGTSCPECKDDRRERRLIQAVTDTLKPYGLTWKSHSFDVEESTSVVIRFGETDFIVG